MTPRDYKGKGFTEFAPFDRHYVGAGELPWDKLDRDEVRRLATSEKARFLPRSYRMAAGRDPGLIWDDRIRSYRLVGDDAPAPPTASDGEGASKVRVATTSRPASATNFNANSEIAGGDNA
jgi:hypothetical protein